MTVSLTKIAWRHAHTLSEGTAEIAVVAKATAFHNITDGKRCGCQHTLGGKETAGKQILHGRFSRNTLKQMRQMRGTQVIFLLQRVQGIILVIAILKALTDAVDQLGVLAV